MSIDQITPLYVTEIIANSLNNFSTGYHWVQNCIDNPLKIVLHTMGPQKVLLDSTPDEFLPGCW